MGLEAFKNRASNFVGDMRYAYQQSKKYLGKGDKVILGVATGAITLFTLGILTKPAYTYLVGRLKDKSETFAAHQLSVAQKIDQKARKTEAKNTDTVTITDTDKDFTDADLKNLFKERPDTKNLILLGCTKITDNALKNLPENLISLTLTGCDRITDKGVEHLKNLKNLETLELAGCDSITDESLATVGQLAQLKHLDLGGCFNLTNEGMQKLSKPLESLDISDCKKIDGNGVRELQKKNLKTLNLERTAVSDTAWAVSFPLLESLSLEGSFKSINLLTSDKLKYFAISDSSEKGPEELNVWLPKSLEELRIINSPQIMHGIKNMESLPNVKILDLRKNGYIPEGFLTKISRESLEKIDLRGTPNESINLSGFTNLKEIILEDKTESPPPEMKKEEPSRQEMAPKIEKQVRFEDEQNIALPKNLEGLDPANTLRIKLSSNATDEDLENLVRFGFKSLQELDLSDCSRITEEGLAYLKQLQNLRTLNLSRCRLSSDAWDSIGEMTQLSSLTLDDSNFSENDFYKITSLRGLETLSLRSLNFSDTISNQLPALKTLKSLTLKNKNLNKEELRNLQKSVIEEKAKLASLQEAKMKESALHPSKYNLENGVLTLEPHVNDKDLLLLKTLPNFETIQTVNLQNNKNITDAGLRVLGDLKALKTLDLTNCTGVHGEFCFALSSLKQIESLNFSSCSSFGDSGLDLLNLISNPPIKTLNLSGTAITDNALSHLKKLGELESVDLKGTKLTKESIEKFGSEYPNVKIARDI